MTYNETYFSDEMKEIARILYKHGLKIGKSLKDNLESGGINHSETIIVLVPFEEIDVIRFSLLTRFTMGMGTEKAGMAGNFIISLMGGWTGVTSIIQYKLTNNLKAKVCYSLSTLCSASAIMRMSEGFATLARSSHISQTACISESLGWIFMNLGDKMQAIGLQLEGKPIPARLKKYTYPGVENLGFIKPGYVNMIGVSGKQIFVGISLVFSIYAYSKIIIKSYQYGQQFINKN